MRNGSRDDVFPVSGSILGNESEIDTCVTNPGALGKSLGTELGTALSLSYSRENKSFQAKHSLEVWIFRCREAQAVKAAI